MGGSGVPGIHRMVQQGNRSCHTGHPSTRSVLCSLVPFGESPFLTAHTHQAKLPDTHAQKSKIQGLQDESGESINEERKNSQPGNHEETQKITELGFTLLLNSDEKLCATALSSDWTTG